MAEADDLGGHAGRRRRPALGAAGGAGRHAGDRPGPAGGLRDDRRRRAAGWPSRARWTRSPPSLAGAVTVGQAFGGDLEAVTVHTGLLAARHVLRRRPGDRHPGAGQPGHRHAVGLLRRGGRRGGQRGRPCSAGGRSARCASPTPTRGRGTAASPTTADRVRAGGPGRGDPGGPARAARRSSAARSTRTSPASPTATRSSGWTPTGWTRRWALPRAAARRWAAATPRTTPTSWPPRPRAATPRCGSRYRRPRTPAAEPRERRATAPIRDVVPSGAGGSRAARLGAQGGR